MTTLPIEPATGSLWHLKRDPAVIVRVLGVNPPTTANQDHRIQFQDTNTTQITRLMLGNFLAQFEPSVVMSTQTAKGLRDLAGRFWEEQDPENRVALAQKVLHSLGLDRGAVSDRWTWTINYGAERTATESIQVPIGMTIQFGGKPIAALARATAGTGSAMDGLIALIIRVLDAANQQNALPGRRDVHELIQDINRAAENGTWYPGIGHPVPGRNAPRSILRTPPPALQDVPSLDDDPMDGTEDICSACGQPVTFSESTGWVHMDPKLDGHAVEVE